MKRIINFILCIFLISHIFAIDLTGYFLVPFGSTKNFTIKKMKEQGYEVFHVEDDTIVFSKDGENSEQFWFKKDSFMSAGYAFEAEDNYGILAPYLYVKEKYENLVIMESGDDYFAFQDFYTKHVIIIKQKPFGDNYMVQVRYMSKDISE